MHDSNTRGLSEGIFDVTIPSPDTSRQQPLSHPFGKGSETLAAPYNYRNLAEVRASIASGSFATDIPGVKVEERIYGCPVVTIGDKRPVGNEKSSFAVDRSRVVEWAVPFDAIDQQAHIGKSVFYMRKHIPTDRGEYSTFPPTPEIMRRIGAEKIYDDYAVLNAHGWVSGDKTSFTPTEGEHGSVARETYFSKSNAFLPPDVDIYSLEPVGHLARKDEKGRPFTPNEEIAYMDIDNYVAAIEEAVNQIALEKARRDEASGKKSTVKLVLTGHSWGGRSVAQISKELITEMHAQGIDVVGYLQEPAFRMHGGFNAMVPPVVSMLRPLTNMVNEPTGDLSKKAKDGVEKVRGTLTKTVIDQLGNIMQLEPGDSMMQRAHETSMSATLETLAGLSERPLTDFRARQLCLQPWIGMVELSGKDTLVDNGKLGELNKAVIIADRGHVTQRDDIAALMQAETVVALMGIDAKRRGEDQQKLSAIRSALTA